jgi:hypothetical protein
MAIIQINLEEIPHGHGLSFKKGVADGLLDCRDNEGTVHKTNAASYQRGVEIGTDLKRDIAHLVKK